MSRWRRRTGARGSRKRLCITTVSQVCHEMRRKKRLPEPRCISSLPVSPGNGPGVRPGRRSLPGPAERCMKHAVTS